MCPVTVYSCFYVFQFGDTILIHAVKNSHLEVVKALLKKCADVDVEGVVRFLSANK